MRTAGNLQAAEGLVASRSTAGRAVRVARPRRPVKTALLWSGRARREGRAAPPCGGGTPRTGGEPARMCDGLRLAVGGDLKRGWPRVVPPGRAARGSAWLFGVWHLQAFRFAYVFFVVITLHHVMMQATHARRRKTRPPGGRAPAAGRNGLPRLGRMPSPICPLNSGRITEAVLVRAASEPGSVLAPRPYRGANHGHHRIIH